MAAGPILCGISTSLASLREAEVSPAERLLRRIDALRTRFQSLTEKKACGPAVRSITAEVLEIYGESHGSFRTLTVQLMKDIVKGLHGLEKDDDSGTVQSCQRDLRDTLHRLDETALSRRARIQASKAPNPLSFLRLPDARIPRAEVLIVFSSYYGERLTKQLFDSYVGEKQQVIGVMQIRLLILAAAADVQQADLMQLHKGDRAFHELSPEELMELLKHFRMGRDEKELLDYLHIPLTPDKRQVEKSYLETLPERSLEEQQLKLALVRLAALESIQLWQPRRHIRGSAETVLQRLERIEKEGAKALHPYPEFRFVEFVSLAGAALELGRSLPEEQMEDLLRHLVELIDHVKILEGEDDRVHELKTRILDAKAAKSWDSGPLLRAFESDSSVPEELREHLRMPEFFARKIAYLHSPHTQEGSPRQQFMGTIVPVFEGDRKVLYQTQYVYADGGFIFQSLMPMDPVRYVKEGKPIPVVVTFQGTNFGVSASRRRDLAANPGYAEWESGEALERLQNQLLRGISKSAENWRELKFALTLTGHSLGASDAQHAAGELCRAYLEGNEESKLLWGLLDSLEVVTFSAPGCAKGAIENFWRMQQAMPDKVKPVLHSLVHLDIVPMHGDGKLGSIGSNGMHMIAATTPKANKNWFHRNAVIRHTEYLYCSDEVVRPLAMVQEGSKHYRIYTEPALGSPVATARAASSYAAF